MNWEIEFYQKPNNDIPMLEFLEELEKRNPKLYAKMLRDMDLLEEFGKDLKPPYSKYLSDGLFELRVKHATNISRVFYFFFVGKKIIVTNGFVKKTQKTPPGELERARRYKTDYEERNDEKNENNQFSGVPRRTDER